MNRPIHVLASLTDSYVVMLIGASARPLRVQFDDT